MSIGSRLLHLLKANLNALLDKVGPDDKVEELTDDELEAELVRRRERKKREDEQRAARETAERAARARGAQRRETAGASSQRQPGGSANGSARAQRPVRPTVETPQARLARLYRTLDTPVGADLETVKHSFRRLMRKHHPDVNSSTPEKQRQATERSKQITQAYSELEKHLAAPRR